MVVSKMELLWKRTAIIISLISASILGTVVWNHYERVMVAEKPAAALSGKYLAVSVTSRDELVAFMKKEPSIVGVSVVGISLVTNRRTISMFETEDPEFMKAWNDYKANRTANPAVFTPGATHNNSRITNIINGNFECRRTIDTIISGLYPAERWAPITCSIAVPAGFDKSSDFIGFINFFIKDEELLDSEKLRLGKDAIILSSRMYRRDVIEQDTKYKIQNRK